MVTHSPCHHVTGYREWKLSGEIAVAADKGLLLRKLLCKWISITNATTKIWDLNKNWRIILRDQAAFARSSCDNGKCRSSIWNQRRITKHCPSDSISAQCRRPKVGVGRIKRKFLQINKPKIITRIRILELSPLENWKRNVDANVIQNHSFALEERSALTTNYRSAHNKIITLKQIFIFSN